MKDKLEDFWFVVTMPFWKIKQFIKRMYWKIRYGFQRMFKGYDSTDVFEIYANFIDRYSKILVQFRNNHVGHPMDMTEDEWDNVLDEMIYHLHYMNEVNVKEQFPKQCEIMAEHKDKFFQLFSKYFFSLWD